MSTQGMGTQGKDTQGMGTQGMGTQGMNTQGKCPGPRATKGPRAVILILVLCYPSVRQTVRQKCYRLLLKKPNAHADSVFMLHNSNVAHNDKTSEECVYAKQNSVNETSMDTIFRKTVFDNYFKQDF